jgi:O-antigen ligase
VFDSPQAFLFGHEKSMERGVRSSAHNYYLDLIYNFGALALAPLLVLVAYTLGQLWLQRRRLRDSESLLALGAVVLFLVLVESNLKSVLRQPYPGIATFFLWGLLLARLRPTDRESGRNVTDRLHPASP